MPFLQGICSTCLEKHGKLSYAEENGEDNVKYIAKLSVCIPEVDWSKGYFLCENCTEKVNIMYDFRNQCLRCLELMEDETKYFKYEIYTTHNNQFNENEDTNKFYEISYEETVVTGEKINKSLINMENISCDTHNLKSSQNEVFIKVEEVKNDIYENIETDQKLYNNINQETNLDTRQCFNEFKCSQCSKSFNSAEDIQMHYLDCKKVFTEYETNYDRSKDILNENEISKSKLIQKPLEKNHQCNICNRLFSAKYVLSRHIRNIHAADKPYDCDICEQKFASSVLLMSHKRFHAGTRPHICSTCGKGFITVSNLHHHEKIHANKRSYKCDKCPKAFNNSNYLRQHYIRIHLDSSEWKHTCSHCHKRFPLKSILDAHVKIHTGEKNFVCYICGRRCTRKTALRKHIETHSTRTFRCHVCKKEYKKRHSLDIHLTKAHGIGDAKVPERKKNFICHLCPKSYSDSPKLQRHLRSHTGERPFKCGVCEKKFTDKFCLKKHIKVHRALNDVSCNKDVRSK